MEKTIHNFMFCIAFVISSTSGFNHHCNRKCDMSNNTKVCYYRFEMEEYLSFSKACYDCPFNITDCLRPQCIPADGRERRIITVNRQLPGPSIEVCHGDDIVVDVVNRMSSMSTTIHWHGLHQRKTQHQDGVPMVTQCPILPSTIFRYAFPASQTGTFLWHGHVGTQKMDGVFGPLIIRMANDPQAHLYDYDLSDHVIIVNDWLHNSADDQFLLHYHSTGSNKVPSIMLNGIATDKVFVDDVGNPTHIPYKVFMVECGKRYRFRLISSGSMNAPLQFSVDGHVLELIATDGAPIEPVAVDSLIIYTGERFDFVLHTTQKISNYWLKLHALVDGDQRFTSAFQTAILRYEGAPLEDPVANVSYSSTFRIGKLLDPIDGITNATQQNIHTLTSALPDDESLLSDPDYKFFITYDYYFMSDPRFNDPLYFPLDSFPPAYRHQSTVFNNISFMMPPAPLLTQRDSVPEELICNYTSIKRNCSEEFCHCVHLLKVSLNSVVEVIFVDEGFYFNASHVIHIHGHYFRVVEMAAMENITLDKVQSLDKERKLPRKLLGAVKKDTVNVPYKGYTVLRFYADNPGFWLMHCHMDFHMELGMALVFQVGELEQMPITPKNFPRCENWLPPFLFHNNSA